MPIFKLLKLNQVTAQRVKFAAIVPGILALLVGFDRLLKTLNGISQPTPSPSPTQPTVSCSFSQDNSGSFSFKPENNFTMEGGRISICPSPHFIQPPLEKREKSSPEDLNPPESPPSPESSAPPESLVQMPLSPLVPLSEMVQKPELLNSQSVLIPESVFPETALPDNSISSGLIGDTKSLPNMVISLSDGNLPNQLFENNTTFQKFLIPNLNQNTFNIWTSEVSNVWYYNYQFIYYVDGGRTLPRDIHEPKEVYESSTAGGLIFLGISGFFLKRNPN